MNQAAVNQAGEVIQTHLVPSSSYPDFIIPDWDEEDFVYEGDTYIDSYSDYYDYDDYDEESGEYKYYSGEDIVDSHKKALTSSEIEAFDTSATYYTPVRPTYEIVPSGSGNAYISVDTCGEDMNSKSHSYSPDVIYRCIVPNVIQNASSIHIGVSMNGAGSSSGGSISDRVLNKPFIKMDDSDIEIDTSNYSVSDTYQEFDTFSSGVEDGKLKGLFHYVFRFSKPYSSSSSSLCGYVNEMEVLAYFE